jgi:quercetin dioxygenase-like cupin family protein
MAFVCTIPAVATVQRDDGDIRITRYDFVPGAVTGWHTHDLPYFITMLTDGILRMHNGSQVNEAVLSAGDAYSRPAGVQHDVMNGSDHPIAFVEIEVKRPQAVVFGAS